MIDGWHVTVIVPVLNEQEAIAHVIADVPDCVDRVIVVDNDSDDATASVARRAGAKVVFESERGYGIACLSGIREAGDTDILAFIDGGRRDYPEDLLKLLEPVARSQCDLAIGCRYELSESSRGRKLHQRLGTRLACWFIKRIYGIHFEDLGPMRCLRKETYDRLQMKDRKYGWTTEMQIKAFNSGMTILQVPVRYRQRIGKSKISGTVRGTAMAAYCIFYWIFKLAYADRSSSPR